MSIDENYKTILESKEFDEKYYRDTYGLDEDIDPIYHYLLIGSAKNYNPSKDFDTRYYLEENDDVKNSKVNPFLHYISWGKYEGRLPKLTDFNEIKNQVINNKINLIGKYRYSFPILNSNNELLQHFDPNYHSNFNKKSFSKNFLYKKEYFKKNNINYDFFVIPDKSVVCKNLLPFKYNEINREIDELNLIDFTNHFDESHYFKYSNHLNISGNELFFSKLIKNVDKTLDNDSFQYIIKHNQLKLFSHENEPLLLLDFNFARNDKYSLKNYSPTEKLFLKKPLNLKEKNIPERFYEKYDEMFYYYNKESYSDLRALIFHTTNIDMLKYLFPFYFKEVLICNDYGMLNRELIKWFNPNNILEIRNENFIPYYKDPEWIENSIDFLEDYHLESPKCEFINNNHSKNKVSVIIPVYNVEKYLEQCLDSVINQTLKDIEIICVNDETQDNSLEILKQYAKKDNRIKIINTANHGLGAARNYGFDQATGDYIFFLDSDDWIKETALEKLYNKITESELDMVFYQMINYIDEDNSLVNDHIYDHEGLQHDNLHEREFFTYKDVEEHLFTIPVTAYSKLYKKSFLLDNNFRFPEGILYEDNEFFYDAFFNCRKAGFIKEHLLYRRRHKNSITGKFNKRHVEMITAMNNTLKIFIKNNKYELFKQNVINHTFSNVIRRFMDSPLYFKDYFFKKIKKDFIGFNELKNDFKENLTESNKLIFNLINKNDYYIKFDSEYNLAMANYYIYTGNEILYIGTDEHKKFIENEKNKNYKISVIIPIYNNNTLTHRTMMSIENQTLDFNEIEVLLINDNSSDETHNIINEYAKNYENVKAIHCTKSSGSSGTPRNIGIKECASEHIMFLDHDDFFELDALEKLYYEVTSTKLDVVFGTYSVIQNQNVVTALTPHEKRGYFHDLSENERLIAIPAPSIWTKLFNTKFIREHEILFPTILGEDAIFMMEVLFDANGIKYLWDSNICYHDLRNSSTTNNISFKYMEELFVSEIFMYEYFENKGKPYLTKYRGLNIIDFAMNQLYDSNLNHNAINSLFDIMRKFILIHAKMECKPYRPRNKILFDLILMDDVDSLIRYLDLNEYKIENYDKINSINKQLNNEKEQLIQENNQLRQSNIKLKNLNKQLLDSNGERMTKSLTMKSEINPQKNNEKPLLSIIIPVYNKEEYVEKTIHSIFKQTYDNIEVICVDDCSTDNSLKIIEELLKRYPKLKLIKNEYNLGSGSSRNKGITECKGEYLMFIDADDYIVDINSFDTFINTAKEHNANMVCGNLEYIVDGEIVIENEYLKHIKEFRIKKPNEYGIPWYFTRNLYDAHLIKNKNIMFPSSKFGEDPVFLTNILLNIDFYVEIPLRYYRYLASDVVKRNSFEKYYEDVSNISKVFKLLSPHKEFENTLNIYSNVFLSRLYIDNYVQSEEELLKLMELYENLLENLKLNNESIYLKLKEPIAENMENTKSKLK